MRWELIGRNVATLVTPPPPNVFEVRILTIAQARQLLQHVAGTRNAALYHVTLLLGLRRSEVLGLRWQDVDLEQATLTIHGALHLFPSVEARADIHRRRPGFVIDVFTEHAALVQPKTKAGRRTLPLSPALCGMLAAHRERQRAYAAERGDRWVEHGLVFPSTVGTPITPRNLSRSFAGMLKKAGLPHMRFHDLRHSCASFLAASNPPTPPRVAMEILGHANIHPTLQFYTKALDINKQ